MTTNLHMISKIKGTLELYFRSTTCRLVKEHTMFFTRFIMQPSTEVFLFLKKVLVTWTY